MEKYWQFAFAWFFHPYLNTHDHLWTMRPVELPPVSAEWPWHSLSYLAKVHFQCPVNIFAIYLASYKLLHIYSVYTIHRLSSIRAGRLRRGWSISGSAFVDKVRRRSAKFFSNHTVSSAKNAIRGLHHSRYAS